MAIWAVGDIQGCGSEFDALLRAIDFSPARDRLWLVGDLVNRGPQSLAVLRRVRELGDAAVTVLGNHDLNLLAVAAGLHKPRPSDTLLQVLDAPDSDALLDWLRHRPLLHHDRELGATLVHAGLPPQWSLETARTEAAAVEAALRDPGHRSFLGHMYGNQPDHWDPGLDGDARLRFTVNALTRMRFCSADGYMEFTHKGPPGSQPESLLPWYALDAAWKAETRVVCGHWSALGLLRRPDILALDTGCVWGGPLTAVRLDAEGCVQVDSRQPETHRK